MSLRVVGVGLGRTGTNSLKLALEHLLGAPCHHMLEVFANPAQIPLWTAAAEGNPDWPATFDGYAATVDWPGAAFWRQLVDEYPDAVVLCRSARAPTPGGTAQPARSSRPSTATPCHRRP